jgi:hypothetical protein
LFESNEVDETAAKLARTRRNPSDVSGVAGIERRRVAAHASRQSETAKKPTSILRIRALTLSLFIGGSSGRKPANVNYAVDTP